jgi:hypothetical protein
MLDLIAAISSVDPPSFVAWLVLACAAGMYPVGLMLGAPCSPCCGECKCEPICTSGTTKTVAATLSNFGDLSGTYYMKQVETSPVKFRLEFCTSCLPYGRCSILLDYYPCEAEFWIQASHVPGRLQNGQFQPEPGFTEALTYRASPASECAQTFTAEHRLDPEKVLAFATPAVCTVTAESAISVAAFQDCTTTTNAVQRGVYCCKPARFSNANIFMTSCSNSCQYSYDSEAAFVAGLQVPLTAVVFSNSGTPFEKSYNGVLSISGAPPELPEPQTSNDMFKTALRSRDRWAQFSGQQFAFQIRKCNSATPQLLATYYADDPVYTGCPDGQQVPTVYLPSQCGGGTSTALRAGNQKMSLSIFFWPPRANPAGPYSGSISVSLTASAKCSSNRSLNPFFPSDCAWSIQAAGRELSSGTENMTYTSVNIYDAFQTSGTFTQTDNGVTAQCNVQ